MINDYNIHSAMYAHDSQFFQEISRIGHSIFWWRFDPRALQNMIHNQANFRQILQTEIYKTLSRYSEHLEKKGLAIDWFRNNYKQPELVKFTLYYSGTNHGGSVLSVPDQGIGRSVSHMTLSTSVLLDSSLHSTLLHELGHLIANFLNVEINRQAPYPLIEGFADYMSHLHEPCAFGLVFNSGSFEPSKVLEKFIDIQKMLSFSYYDSESMKLSHEEIYTHSRLFIEFLFENFHGSEFLNIFETLFLTKPDLMTFLMHGGGSQVTYEVKRISTLIEFARAHNLQEKFSHWLLRTKQPQCYGNKNHVYYPIPQYIIEPKYMTDPNNISNVNNFENLSWKPSANLTWITQDLPTRIGLECALGATNSLLFISLQQLSKYLKKKYPEQKQRVSLLIDYIARPIGFAGINLARIYINGPAHFSVDKEFNPMAISLIGYFGSSLTTTWIVQAIQYGVMRCLQGGNVKKNISQLFTLLMYLHCLSSFFVSEDFKENSAAASIGLAVNLLTSILIQLVANCLLPEQSQKKSDDNKNTIEMENLEANRQVNRQNHSKKSLLFSTHASPSSREEEQPMYTNISRIGGPSHR